MTAVALWRARSAAPALGLACLVSACVGDDEMARRSAAMEDPKVLLRLASAAREGADYRTAINFYGRALALDPSSADAELGIADSYVSLGDAADAERHYLSAKSLDPARPEIEFGLGRVRLAERDPVPALTAFERAEQRGVRSAALYNDKGIALDLVRRHTDAQAAYRQGLAEAPMDRALRENYGLSLVLSGQYREAVDILGPLAAEPDASARTRQNLALALGLAGDPGAARKLATQDLAPAAVENNLRFYAAARDNASAAAPAASSATAQPEASAVPAQAAARTALAAPSPPAAMPGKPAERSAMTIAAAPLAKPPLPPAPESLPPSGSASDDPTPRDPPRAGPIPSTPVGSFVPSALPLPLGALSNEPPGVDAASESGAQTAHPAS